MEPSDAGEGRRVRAGRTEDGAEPVVLTGGGSGVFVRQVLGMLLGGAWLVAAGVASSAPILARSQLPPASGLSAVTDGSLLDLYEQSRLDAEMAIQVGGITVQTLGVSVGVAIALMIAAISGNRVVRVGDYTNLVRLAFGVGTATVSLAIIAVVFVRPPWTVGVQIVLLAVLAVILTGAVPGRAKTSSERGREWEVWRALGTRRLILGQRYAELASRRARTVVTAPRWRSVGWWTVWMLVGPAAAVLAAAPLMVVIGLQGASWAEIWDIVKVVAGFSVVLGYWLLARAGDRWVSVPKESAGLAPRARRTSAWVALTAPVLCVVSTLALVIGSRFGSEDAPSWLAYALLALWLLSCLLTSYCPLRWCIQAPESLERAERLTARPGRVVIGLTRFRATGWALEWGAGLRRWLVQGYLWLTYRRVRAQYSRALRQVRSSPGRAPTIVEPRLS